MKPKLAIFCGARFPQLPPAELAIFKSQVVGLIHQLAAHFSLVYGGGHVGLMGLVADSFLQKKAHVTGVIPGYLNSIEIQHQGLSETEVVDDLHERKALMEKLADYYLVLPGGIGTLDELCEVLTLQTLNRHQKKIFIWNWKNLFGGFLQFIATGQKVGFVNTDILEACIISDNQDKLIDALLKVLL